MTDSGIQRPSTRPTPEHEEFIRVLLDTVEERLLSQLPTMGTVSGTPEASGGTVKVHVDGEDEPRSLGFARSAGVTYQDGDRVLLVPNRAGEYVIAGIIATGNKPVVGKSDVQAGAIGKEQMGANSVGSDQIIGGCFTTKMLPTKSNGEPDSDGPNGFTLDGGYIKPNSISGNQIANKEIDTGQLKSGSVTGRGTAQNNDAILKEATIGNADIKDGAIEGSKIAKNTIGGEAEGTPAKRNIALKTITGGNIKDQSIKWESLDKATIFAGLLADNGFIDDLKKKLGL